MLLNVMIYSDCPSTVTVSPSSGPFKVGDVLTCMSDGFPEPSYTWTNGDGDVVSTGPSITLTKSSFTLNCTATGNFTTLCSASYSVSGNERMTAVSTDPTTIRFTGSGTKIYFTFRFILL